MGRPAACRSAGRQRFGICARVRRAATDEGALEECSNGTSESSRMPRRSPASVPEPIEDRNAPAGANRQGPRPRARKLPSGQPGWRRESALPLFPAAAGPAAPAQSPIPPHPGERRDCGSSLSRRSGRGLGQGLGRSRGAPPDPARDLERNAGGNGVFRAGAGDAGPRQPAPAPKTGRRNQPSRKFPRGCRRAGQDPTSRVPGQEAVPGPGRKGFGGVRGARKGHRSGQQTGWWTEPGIERGQGFAASRFSLGGHRVQQADFMGADFMGADLMGGQRSWRRNSTTLPRIRQDPGGGRSVSKSGFSGRSSIPSCPR